jgi:putative inorganic carbon (HCO3(-)) transporter
VDNIQLKIDNTRHQASQDDDGGFIGKLKNTAAFKLLYGRTGIILLVCLAILTGFGVATMGVVFAALILAVAIGIPMLIGMVMYAEFGIIVVLMMAYNLFLLMRIGIQGPLGVVMDVMNMMLMLGLIIRARRERNWHLLGGSVSIMVLVWIGYNFLQIGNPNAESRMAWIYTIRTVAVVLLMYYVFLYNIRSVKMVRIIFKLWLAMALFAALYAAKQEYIGFSAAEQAYLDSDPEIAGLLFIGGHWRKFSIFSDPVTYAYNMVMPAIMCICIVAGKFKLWKKIVLVIFTCIYLQTMLFSGTRGANVLLPAALFLFAILHYNKKVLIFSIFAALFLVFLINVPTGNPNLVRFQTAFRPNNDDSYNLRKANQKRIQPYIQTHPFGGGLGATGTWGKKYAPASYLANFPPDSGYMRVAVELGWIGLLIFCTLVFTILKTGINNFYRIKNPELKTYCLAMTLVIFAYNIANFPQEALVQYPSNVLFSLAAALITVTYRLDQQTPKEPEAVEEFTEEELIKY